MKYEASLLEISNNRNKEIDKNTNYLENYNIDSSPYIANNESVENYITCKRNLNRISENLSKKLKDFIKTINKFSAQETESKPNITTSNSLEYLKRTKLLLNKR